MSQSTCTSITPYHLGVRMMAAGVKEIPGTKTNALIAAMNWLALGKSNEDDPWCGSFLKFTHYLLGYETPPNPAGARNWLRAGTTVKIEDAKPGDVVILWRESPQSWKGHVGFFHAWGPGTVRLLGGNQSDGVNVASFARNRILGVRRPKPAFDFAAAIARATPGGVGGREV
jgi:uncharacterized protein (TIGR02594 family)